MIPEIEKTEMKSKLFGRIVITLVVCLLCVLMVCIPAVCAASDDSGKSANTSVKMMMHGVNITADDAVAGWGYEVSTDPGVTHHELNYSAIIKQKGDPVVITVKLQSGYLLDVQTKHKDITVQGGVVTVSNIDGGVNLSISAKGMGGYSIAAYKGVYAPWDGTGQKDPEPIHLFAERLTNDSDVIKAMLSGQLGTTEKAKVNSWTVSQNLADYLGLKDVKLNSDKSEVHASMTDGNGVRLTGGNTQEGTITLVVQNDEEETKTMVKGVLVKNWNNTEPGSKTDTRKIGENNYVILKVRGDTVDTDEKTATTAGWDTCVKFDFASLFPQGTEMTPASVSYKVGDDETTDYQISNGGSDGTFTQGGNLFIVKNNLGGTGIGVADKLVTIGIYSFRNGDATMNSFVNVGDSSVMGADILRGSGSKLLTGEHFLYANVNTTSGSEEVIDAMDVQWLNRYLVTGEQPTM